VDCGIEIVSSKFNLVIIFLYSNQQKKYLDFGRLPHKIRLIGVVPDCKSGVLYVLLQRGFIVFSKVKLILNFDFNLPKSKY